MTSFQKVPFPPSGGYVQAIRTTSASLRESSGVIISQEAIQRFVYSPAFSSTFTKLSQSHGLALPLNFSSQLSELNLLCVLGLVNFGSGYRAALHAHAGRGAWDSIRALIISMFLTSAVDGDDLLSAKGMKNITIEMVASLMQLPVHTEKPHPTIPGVIVGERGGPLYDLIKIVTSTLNETGVILLSQGYHDLGSFVLEALKKGERVGNIGSGGVDVDVVLEQIVLAFPAFRDMALVDGQPAYVFKKALFLLHSIWLRFGSRKDGGPVSKGKIPVPETSSLPIFSDNVIPSILIHLGIIDVSHASDPFLVKSFRPSDKVDALLRLSADEIRLSNRELPRDGPLLTEIQAYILRASAIEACERIVEEAHKAVGEHYDWLRKLTLTELDFWLWAGAKDRLDYRELERFVLRDTVYF